MNAAYHLISLDLSLIKMQRIGKALVKAEILSKCFTYFESYPVAYRCCGK